MRLFVGLLISIANASNHTKCVSLNNQKCMTQPTLIDLHPNEYSQGFYYYLFAVILAKFSGICNTFNDLSDKVCVPNKTEDLNPSVFSMITGKNESKKLTKHISCKCKCKFNGRKCDSDQWWSNDKCQCECKKSHACEKDYAWKPATCSSKNGKKYLASIMDDSAIMCDELTESYNEETKIIPTIFLKKKATCKTQNFCFACILLITIALLTAVNI